LINFDRYLNIDRYLTMNKWIDPYDEIYYMLEKHSNMIDTMENTIKTLEETIDTNPCVGDDGDDYCPHKCHLYCSCDCDCGDVFERNFRTPIKETIEMLQGTVKRENKEFGKRLLELCNKNCTEEDDGSFNEWSYEQLISGRTYCYIEYDEEEICVLCKDIQFVLNRFRIKDYIYYV
jgi:hypothetical protein